jgi:hypothetical protein
MKLTKSKQWLMALAFFAYALLRSMKLAGWFVASALAIASAAFLVVMAD